MHGEQQPRPMTLPSSSSVKSPQQSSALSQTRKYMARHRVHNVINFFLRNEKSHCTAVNHNLTNVLREELPIEKFNQKMLTVL